MQARMPARLPAVSEGSKDPDDSDDSSSSSDSSQGGNAVRGSLFRNSPAQTTNLRRRSHRRKKKTSPRVVSRKAVPETLSWDGTNEAWMTFEQKMRGALTQRNLGYMIDETFVDYYLRYGFEGVLNWFPDYAKTLSSAQIQSDTTFFYGVLQGAFST